MGFRELSTTLTRNSAPEGMALAGETTPGADSALPERIRHAAYELFGRYSYHGTTIRMIANMLGVSVPTLYYYYKSKQELLVGILQLDLEESLRTLERATEGHEAPLRALDAAVRCQIQRRMVFAIRGLIHRSDMRFVEPQHRARVIPLRDRYEQVFQDILSRCYAEGLATPRDPAIVARAILQMTAGISDWYRAGGPLTAVEIEDQYVQLVWSMIEATERPALQATMPAVDGGRLASSLAS